jgi:branched-chain amino acid transport system substrate-binding protein
METDEASAGRHNRSQAADSGAVVRTFLIADVRGYTSFTQAHGDEAAGALAAKFAALAREAVTATGGEVLELRGDEALCVFPSARQALRAAVELQIRFRSRVDGEPVFPLGIGIGLAAGEAVPVEGGYRGGSLNLAARLCSLAAAGQIFASEMVTGLAGTLEGVRFVERRRVRVKGLDRPVRAIEVVPEVELPPVPATRKPSSRRRMLLVVAALAIAVAGIAAAVAIVTRGDGSGSLAAPSIVPDSLAVIDPDTNEVVGQVQIPGRPSLVAAAEGLIWAASDASRTVSTVATETRRVRRVVAPNATPSALAAEGRAVWVLDANRRLLLEIDPTYGEVTDRIELGHGSSLPAADRSVIRPGLASGAGALWVTDGSTRLLRVESGSGRVRALDVGEPLSDVAVGDGAVWAVSGPAASAFHIDTEGRAVQEEIQIVSRRGSAAPYPVAVAVGEGSVWVLNGNTQTVSRIDPEVAGVSATIPLGIGRSPSDIAAGGGAVWVPNAGNGTVTRIDTTSNSATAIPLGNSPTGVAVGGGGVWVSVQPGFSARGALPVGASQPASGSRAGALPASRCGPVEFEGEGQPRYLVASDLPFQGLASLRETLQMSDAIRFVLAKHGYKAGRYSVGHQSCDDSIAATGNYDPGTCNANAQAYAASRRVVGVIGGYNSGCVQAQLPVLAEAPGGPLALIGTASTYVGLTRAGHGTAPGEPRKYYPGEKRGFVRLVATDDSQGAANALLARRLGVKRLFVLHDGDPYGHGIASSVRRAAQELGIRVVGFRRWDPRARTYGSLARAIQQTNPDGVFLGGSTIESNLAPLIKDLGTTLGRGVRILGPDGFTPISAFAELVGPAAEGITVSVTVPALERLGPEGRRFLSDFRQAIGRPVETYSVVAAQATEVLLDAIARSDGTRASVTRELFNTKVSNGILGSFSFDRIGDTTAGAIPIYRVERGKPVLFTVITPPPNLVR